MLEKWFPKIKKDETLPEVVIVKQSHPYERLIPKLEILPEEDVQHLEGFIDNLKNRKSFKSEKVDTKLNGRTKDKSSKERTKNRESIRENKKLEDEIESAKQQLVQEKFNSMKGFGK